jgi:hypothetical protein
MSHPGIVRGKLMGETTKKPTPPEEQEECFKQRICFLEFIYDWDSGEKEVIIHNTRGLKEDRESFGRELRERMASLRENEFAYRVQILLEPPDELREKETEKVAHCEPAWGNRSSDLAGQSIESWLAQAIFHRMQNLVPPKSFGPDIGAMRSSWGEPENINFDTENRVFVELPKLGAFKIEVTKIR